MPKHYDQDVVFAYTPDWELDETHPRLSGGYVTFNLIPRSGSTHTFKGGDTVTFTFKNVTINAVAGAAKVQITEGSSGDPSEITKLHKLPPGSNMAGITFLAEPHVVAANDPEVHVVWSGPSTATYELEYYPTGRGTRLPSSSPSPSRFRRNPCRKSRSSKGNTPRRTVWISCS